MFPSYSVLSLTRGFFCHVASTTEIYTLSLHDALPIFTYGREEIAWGVTVNPWNEVIVVGWSQSTDRSEEHTSELQSLRHLVCRLLLEKKKNITRRDAVKAFSQYLISHILNVVVSETAK